MIRREIELPSREGNGKPRLHLQENVGSPFIRTTMSASDNMFLLRGRKKCALSDRLHLLC